MKLIDVDELMERMRKWMPKDPCGKEQTIEEVVATNIAVSVCMEIEETPTAFDKEKVLSEMKKEYEDAICLYNGSIGTAHSFASLVRKDAWRKALNIVEKGGIE